MAREDLFMLTLLILSKEKEGSCIRFVSIRPLSSFKLTTIPGQEKLTTSARSQFFGIVLRYLILQEIMAKHGGGGGLQNDLDTLHTSYRQESQQSLSIKKVLQWKCNFPSFQEIMTNQLTDQPTNQTDMCGHR